MTTFKSYIGADDLSLWDGKTRTFTRSTSTGGSLTLNKVGVVVDILNLFGGGTAFTDTTLSLALSHIGSTNATLVLTPGTWTLSNNVTVPLNITLCLPQGAVLSVASGKTLTINGSIDAGLYQIFSGSGTVSISGTYVQEVYPQWWGGKGDGTTDDTTAIQAAVTAGKWIHITGGTWVVNTAINVRGYRHIYGAGKENTVIKAGASLTGFVFSSTDGASGDWLPATSITDLSIDGNGSADALGGIYAEFITEWEFERLRIYGFYKSTAIGIQLDHAYQIAFRDCYIRMGAAGPGKKGTACFQVGASTADAIHTTHITFDNCLAQYSGTGFLLAALGNKGDQFTIRQCASGNHDYGIRIQDFYRSVRIENTLVENTSINGIRASTATAYNIKDIDIKGVTLYENTIGIYTDQVDGLGMDKLRFAGDDAGGHTMFSISAATKRVELGTYVNEDTAYNTVVAASTIDPRLPNLALNDATPSVAVGGKRMAFKTQSSVPTTITMFDDGVVGQEITIFFNDANTTIDFTGTNLKGNGGADFTGAVGDVMTGVFDGTNWYFSKNVDSGNTVQVATTQTGAVATGTTVMPYDDTIPQNTEGDEYMTLAITPTATTNKLIIEITAVGAASVAAVLIGALFQDTTANALAAAFTTIESGSGKAILNFKHTMTAGTTSATTFKFRMGLHTAGTTTFNGNGGSRTMGGVAASSIVIKEIRA